MGSLSINLLGTSFSIEANETDEYLDKLMKYYKSVIQQVEKNAGVKDPLKLAIIAGITIADDYCNQQVNSKIANDFLNQEDLIEAEKITKRMIDNINKVIT